MICTVCNSRDSKLHITEIDKVTKKVRSLDICVECAIRTGLLPSHGHAPVNALIKTAIRDILEPKPETDDDGDLPDSISLTDTDLDLQSTSKGKAKKCPNCQTTFDDIKASGRFGCDHDYDYFFEEVESLFGKLHYGTHHTGKVPRNLTEMRSRQTELTRLKSELEDAIVLENYEEAAQLRDRIKHLQGDWPPA